MGDNVHLGAVDVLVLLNEVVANDGSENFRRIDWVLFSKDVDGVLDRVCGNDDAVVGLGIAVESRQRIGR